MDKEMFWGFIGFGAMFLLICAGYALITWIDNKCDKNEKEVKL